ncbi:MAG: nitrous oxide reductase accessory protein NosL [Blastocatellales bacterium]
MVKISTSKIQSDLKLLCAALLFIALSGCGKPPIEPVDIAAEDMCALCKMAISEKQYAAEFLNRDGDAFKFDDISCMANYVAEKKAGDSIAAFYVVDFDTKQWLKAEEANFVASPNFPTPMGGGIVAFKDRPRAEAEAAANQGRQISFAEALGGGKK